VVEDRVIVAASVLEGIGEDWHAVERAVLVDAAGQCQHVRRPPLRRDDGLSERVPQNLTDEGGLPGVFRVPPPATVPSGVVQRVPERPVVPPGGLRDRVGDPPGVGGRVW
jgi:hypothetical protein